jgi:ABC-type antimicrobial peptide transport system permease subunit
MPPSVLGFCLGTITSGFMLGSFLAVGHYAVLGMMLLCAFIGLIAVLYIRQLDRSDV